MTIQITMTGIIVVWALCMIIINLRKLKKMKGDG